MCDIKSNEIDDDKIEEDDDNDIIIAVDSTRTKIADRGEWIMNDRV